MTIPIIFSKRKEANDWLIDNYGTKDPEDTRKKDFGSKELSEPKFTILDAGSFGTVVVYRTQDLNVNDVETLIKSTLQPNATRDDLDVHEGTSKSIANELGIDNAIMLEFLRDNRKTDLVQYSADGDIRPKVNAAKCSYWRIALSSSEKVKVQKKQFKRK